jgi:hypothetical protein
LSQISIAVNIKPLPKPSMSAGCIVTLSQFCVFTVGSHRGVVEENEMVDVETGFEQSWCRPIDGREVLTKAYGNWEQGVDNEIAKQV